MNAKLVKIKGGWAAVAPGWTVFGETTEAVAAKFAKAEEVHAAILARPAPDGGSIA